MFNASSTRQPRYHVSFATASANGAVGKSKELLLQREQLGFMLAFVSPFEHESWMRQVDLLRRGNKTIIRYDEVSQDGLKTIKLLSVLRA